MGYVIAGLLIIAATNLSERVAIEVAALGVLLLLVLAGVVPESRALSGFGNEAVWLVFGMMVVAEGIRQSGLVSRAADWLSHMAKGSSTRLRVGVTVMGAVAGGLLESTAAVTAMLPVASTTARRMQKPAASFYVALALGAMAGGLMTLIGTSGNIVASAALVRLGQPALGFFELLPLGVGFLVVAVLYVVVLGHRVGQADGQDGLMNLRSYVGEVSVPGDSPLVGKRLQDITLFRHYGITVLEIFRDRGQLAPGPTDVIMPGDRLLLAAPAEEHLRWKDIGGLEPVMERTRRTDTDRFVGQAAEVMIPPGSPWLGRSPGRLHLRQQGVVLVALWRQGATVRRHLASTALRVGDLLLIRTDPQVLVRLEANQTVVRAQDQASALSHRAHPWKALAPLALFLALALTGVANLGVAALAGAALALISGVLSPEEAYAAVEWRVPILLGAVLPIASAVSSTGLATVLARDITGLAEGSAIVTVVLIYLAAALFTQVLSNIATAAVMTPIAVGISHLAGLPSHALVVTILAALMMTPLSGAANKPALLVMARGSFRHRDYLKFGLMPSVMGAVVTIVLVMKVWHP